MGTRAARAVLAALLLAATACGSSGGGSPAEGSRPVSFETEDGVRLEGRLFGPSSASAGLVLAHMLPADQSSFYDLAGHLADDGYRVLTFNFRGYCPGGDDGCSEGSKQPEAAPTDLTAAAAELRAQGVTRLGLIGASMGGTAAIRVASTQEGDVATLITLSAPQVVDGLSAGATELQTVTAAKLFIAGNGDGQAAADAETFYLASMPPKRYEILTTDDHGTELLEGSQRQRVIDLIDGWLLGSLPVDAPAGEGEEAA
jgi:pimeloyl-ACP methyl ester carboxylesterase